MFCTDSSLPEKGEGELSDGLAFAHTCALGFGEGEIFAFHSCLEI
jgi:hypothetical protein